MRQILFEDLAELWLADKKQYVKRSTYAAYSLLVKNHLLGYFSSFADFSENSIQEFVMNKLNYGLSQKSVKDMLVVLKMILNYGSRHGYIPYKKFEVHFPTEKTRQEVAVLSRDHQKVIMSYILNHFSYKNLGIYLSLCCGLRIGEVCAMVWNDIDMSRGSICVSRTIQRIYVTENGNHHTELIVDAPKSKYSNREIPLTKEIIHMIRSLRNKSEGSYYVLSNSSHPIEPRIYRMYFNKLIKKLNIPSLKFHSLRHSFATRCIESNCDYKTVSVLLGHSNISTTMNLYVHPNMEHKRKCMEKMFSSLK